MASNSRKVYFITGSNRGIGFELVKQLAKYTSNIVVSTTRNLERSSNLITLADKHRNAKVIALDIGDKSSIDSIHVGLKNNGIYLANAGLSGQETFKSALELDYSTWLKK